MIRTGRLGFVDYCPETRANDIAVSNILQINTVSLTIPGVSLDHTLVISRGICFVIAVIGQSMLRIGFVAVEILIPLT